MRSAYSQAKAEQNRNKTNNFEFVKTDLHSHIQLLEANKLDISSTNRITNKINKLKAEITKLNLQRGKRLAEKLKTKWYNEGERSNKYFLALLRRKELNGELKEIQIENTMETSPEKIEDHVVFFYRKLYNQNLQRSSPMETAELRKTRAAKC